MRWYKEAGQIVHSSSLVFLTVLIVDSQVGYRNESPKIIESISGVHAHHLITNGVVHEEPKDGCDANLAICELIAVLR
eukprot:3295325-Pleurochrysis_carterae.AAC.8